MPPCLTPFETVKKLDVDWPHLMHISCLLYQKKKKKCLRPQFDSSIFPRSNRNVFKLYYINSHKSRLNLIGLLINNTECMCIVAAGGPQTSDIEITSPPLANRATQIDQKARMAAARGIAHKASSRGHYFYKEQHNGI